MVARRSGARLAFDQVIELENPILKTVQAIMRLAAYERQKVRWIWSFFDLFFIGRHRKPFPTYCPQWREPQRQEVLSFERPCGERLHFRSRAGPEKLGD